MTSEPDALFELPAEARVPRRARTPRPRSAPVAPVDLVDMPEPLLPSRPEPQRQDGPCIAGMEEVGTGLLDHVDAMQRVAASAPPGPLLINAGPGTGKTHVLVRRIAYHVAELHLPASQCLVLAADAAAASDIHKQLSELMGTAAGDITIGAFADFAVGSLPPLGHVFVDDMHLMSQRLYDALRADRGQQPAFTATGDPDCLVARDSSPFDAFPRDYPDARVVRLPRNYRSTAPIIAAAGQLITPVTRVPGRAMHPHRPASGTAPIGRYFAPSAADELDFANGLASTLAVYGVDAEDVAVLRADGAKLPGAPIGEVTGRQYRVVCLVGATAEWFPNTPAARRAMYIAATRAEDLLYLSHSATPSPLLDDVDSGLFAAFGKVKVRHPRVEQPRLI
ncbi:MAG TPA: UvrD-helicase domain-containing protein [Stackebrandtia sp.]|uniref:UvrD-helicase domain-containing protein n=1 Tax=Stackebrandtia sp. TaxID=2023065 RepID=UPI002D4F8B61|nr:UvrD-helicase domain-containing protein [Stackebrandtia sp.]HZE37472.1 UvrD-helicase domain-containing protein [Stackebrandtia sp.]